MRRYAHWNKWGELFLKPYNICFQFTSVSEYLIDFVGSRHSQSFNFSPRQQRKVRAYTMTLGLFKLVSMYCTVFSSLTHSKVLRRNVENRSMTTQHDKNEETQNTPYILFTVLSLSILQRLQLQYRYSNGYPYFSQKFITQHLVSLSYYFKQHQT